MTSPVHEILAVGDQHFQGKIISDGALQTKSGGVIFPDNSVQLTAATGSAISSVFGRTGVVIAASGDYTWGQIDKSTSSLADITTRPHSALTSVGANDHHNQSHDNTDHSMATPAIVLGGSAAAGVATSLIRSDATIAAFDATVPGTIGIGDTAATGSIAFAARRDHTHGSPSTWTATAHNLLSSIHGDTTAASATRGDLITAQGASPKWARLAVGASAGMFIRSDATDIGWSTLKLPNAATANYIAYATASNTLGESANLTFDGSRLSLVAAGPSLALTNADSQIYVGGAVSDPGWGVGAIHILPGNLTIQANASDNSSFMLNLYYDGSQFKHITTGGALKFGFANGSLTISRQLTQAAGTAYSGTNMMEINGGITLNDPASGQQGYGTLNVNANVYKDGSAYSNPDYVFEHYYTGEIVKFATNDGAKEYQGLRSLKEIEQFSRKYNALPLIHEARQRNKDVHGNPRLGAFDGGDAVLGSLEELYLHVYQMNYRLERLEKRNG